MNLDLVDLLVNSFIFLFFFSLSIFFIFRIKLESKGYKLMFIAYIFFWLSIMLVREYRSKLQNLIDPNMLWIVLASYGFIGIFFRPLSDYLTMRIKSRKFILYFSLSFMFLMYLILLFLPSTTTNVFATIGIGVGASMIGIYELMFKEQYSKNQSYLTVSILAIPPLLADLLSSPIQSIVSIYPVNFSFSNFLSNSTNSNQINQYLILWLISIFFIIITFIMIFFIKEDRKKIGIIENKNSIISKGSNNSILFFVIICVIGSAIAFVKFSNSGAIAIITIEKINVNYPSVIIKNLAAYISLIFSVFQLLGSISIYFFTRKKKSILVPFSIGIITWLLFHLIISFYQDSYLYFAFTALNGFAYGILYNVVLGFVLSISFKRNKIKPMGIYQSVLAIGITSSSFFVSFLKSNFINQNASYDYWTYASINLILFSVVLIIFIIFVIFNKFNSNFLKEKNSRKYIS